MKITSVQFVFDSGAVVTFVKGSKEVYGGNLERWKGKTYFYDVIVENKYSRFTSSTFSSPSQEIAKTYLENSLKQTA
jgi:hypothetical protein